MHINVVELKFWPGKSVGKNALRTQQRMQSGSASHVQWVYASVSVTQENYKVVQKVCYQICFQNSCFYLRQMSLSLFELQFASLPHFSLCAYLQNANLWLACLSVSRMCIFYELTAMNVLACAGLSATLLSHIIFKRLSTKKDCVILLWRQKVAWALFCIKMADIYN